MQLMYKRVFSSVGGFKGISPFWAFQFTLYHFPKLKHEQRGEKRSYRNQVKSRKEI